MKFQWVRKDPFWCLRHWQGKGALPKRGCLSEARVPPRGVGALAWFGCLLGAWVPRTLPEEMVVVAISLQDKWLVSRPTETPA